MHNVRKFLRDDIKQQYIIAAVTKLVLEGYKVIRFFSYDLT